MMILDSGLLFGHPVHGTGSLAGTPI